MSRTHGFGYNVHVNQSDNYEIKPQETGRGPLVAGST